MRPLKPLLSVLALTAAVSALAGCATRSPSAPGPMASAPTPMEGYDWHSYSDAGETMLAYGVANSDDLRLRFDCKDGTARLSILADADKSERYIHLESGGETERYRARAEASEMLEGDILVAEASSHDPVFQRFRRLGWIALLRGDDRAVFMAHPGSEKRVEAFFSSCG